MYALDPEFEESFFFFFFLPKFIKKKKKNTNYVELERITETPKSANFKLLFSSNNRLFGLISLCTSFA